MTPFFSPPAARVGTAAGVPRRRRQADDRGRGRGVRRLLLPRLHHAVVPARGHAPRAGARSGQGGHDGLDGFDIVGPAFTCVADTEEDSPRRSGARSSRSRSTRPRRRTAACSTTTAGATCNPSSPACRRKASGWRWATSSTTTWCARSPPSATSRPSPASCASAGRRARPASRSTRRTGSTPRCVRTLLAELLRRQLILSSRVVDPLRRELGVDAARPRAEHLRDFAVGIARRRSGDRRRRPRAARAPAGSAPSSGTPSSPASSSPPPAPNSS